MQEVGWQSHAGRGLVAASAAAFRQLHAWLLKAYARSYTHALKHACSRGFALSVSRVRSESGCTALRAHRLPSTLHAAAVAPAGQTRLQQLHTQLIVKVTKA
jgi:hypothetical protein